jgi:mannose-6-phosphate isomerase
MIVDQASPTVRKVEKPWGNFEQFTHNALSTVKIITVDPGGTLSLQYHHRRDELWVIIDSGAQIELGDRVIQPESGERVLIPRGTTHRLSAMGDSAVRVLEISFGEFDEDDIVRVEDVYGRAGSPTP